MKKTRLFLISVIAVILCCAVFIFFLRPSKTRTAKIENDNLKTVKTDDNKGRKDKLALKEEPKKPKDSSEKENKHVISSKENKGDDIKPDAINQNNSMINLEAISKGDFSSIAGTWENPNLSRVIFDNKGLVALVYYDNGNRIINDTYAITNATLQGNLLLGGIGSSTQLVGGAGFYIVPKGIKTPGDGLIYEQDAILIGQSVKAEYEPYYKINDDTSIPEELVSSNTEEKE